jgi:hypothetical protein
MRLILSILGCIAIAVAQTAPPAPAPNPAPGTSAVTVPLSDPAKPAIVKARLVSGNITVTAGNGPQVVVDSEADIAPGGVPPGMHRIDGASRGFKVEEDRNTVTIGADRGGQTVNLLIQVPADTSLEVETTNGSIAIANASGAINARAR